MKHENQNKNFGLILLVLGLFIFFSRFVNLGDFLWPFYIIIPGLLLFVGTVIGGHEFTPLTIPASVITTIGLILFSQNITNNFASWAYAWALIPASVGFGMVLMGSKTFNAKLQEKGYQMTKTFLLTFAVFGAFFELLIFKSWLNSGTSAYVLPIILIISGLYLLKKSRGNYVVFEHRDEDEYGED